MLFLLQLCMYGGSEIEPVIMYGIYQSYLNSFKDGNTKIIEKWVN